MTTANREAAKAMYLWLAVGLVVVAIYLAFMAVNTTPQGKAKLRWEPTTTAPCGAVV